MSLDRLKEFNRAVLDLCVKYDCWFKANGELLIEDEEDVIYHVGGMYDGLDLHYDLDVVESQGDQIEVWGYGPHSPYYPGKCPECLGKGFIETPPMRGGPVCTNCNGRGLVK